MSKKDKKQKSASFKNAIALKRNIYTAVISIIFIAVVIATTVLSTNFAERYPLEIDLTTNKQHSITGANYDYISKVDKKINIYVAMSEKAYSCSTDTNDDLNLVIADSRHVDNQPDHKDYYNQTIELLKKYQDYNDKITVSFLDIYDSKTDTVTDNFHDWKPGDILVECLFEKDGEEAARRTVVPFNEVYTLEDKYGVTEEYVQNPAYFTLMYGLSAKSGQGVGYFITANNVETMVSSAIYKVTSPDTPVFLVPTTISDRESIDEALANVLKINNYEVEYSSDILSNVLAKENHEKYAGIILSNCKSDITTEDRQLIDSFLDNNGQKGKSLFYFAGTTTTKLTNLCGLLGDWGIGFEEGILYETDAGFHNAQDPTMLVLESAGSSYTTKTDALNKYYAGSNMVYMKQLWQSGPLAANVNRNAEAILNTGSFGQTVLMPLGEDPTKWKVPSDAQKYKFVTAIVTEDVKTVGTDYYISYIAAFSSAEIIAEDFSTDSWGNMNLVLEVFNNVTGNADTEFNFVPKVITTQYFNNEESVGEVRVIFMVIVPLIIVALGIFVWFWRKRK